jgi:hypothetical protein
MAKLIGIFGLLAAGFAIADLIHGPHNGDSHRFYIHICEFTSFLALLCLLEILAFGMMANNLNSNRWFIVTGQSLATAVVGVIFFGLFGGSFHGDGGPISTSFLTMAMIGYTVFPIALFGSIVVLVGRFKRKVRL